MKENSENKELGEKIERLQNLLEGVTSYIERMRIKEYIETIQTPVKLMYVNFLAGVFRGFGMAVGMTVLFALLVYLLHRLAALPVIGNFIAELVKIVTEELKK